MTIDHTRRKTLGPAASAAAASMFAIPGTARAQGIPTGGSIRTLTGYPAGGGTDVMARVLAEKLKERLGVSVIVENRAGASGTLANEALKNATPDGSVLLYAPSAGTVAQTVTKKRLNYDLEKDLATITVAGVVAVVYVVSPTLGVRNFAEYVDWLKKNPKKHHFGTTAMGSQTHFFGVELGQALGMLLEPVAYKGAAPLVADLSAGHASAGCGGRSDFLQHHRGDKLRIIAVSSPKRAASAPQPADDRRAGLSQAQHRRLLRFLRPRQDEPGTGAGLEQRTGGHAGKPGHQAEDSADRHGGAHFHAAGHGREAGQGHRGLPRLDEVHRLCARMTAAAAINTSP